MVDPGRVGEDKGLTEESLAEYKTLSIRPLQTLDVENDLEWISRSFSFLGSQRLINTARRNEGLSSEELVEKIALTRGTLIHHLN